ncbi:phosphoglycerate mutase [Rhodococcus sp. WMMA185]|uniref:histidine phosphatase family protein n=1 Tax=Rhodococcus sp. WMMA185 TaxID=679318 RepID=UPI000878F26B|nr:histidine phosphatase family protein [Rhodococcus sp. WMMA185]AOW92725.1 phosphoglycerate mutase [Rhodococcus sp. WMMA185]
MTVVLLRHGLSTSNTAGTLAGRLPGVELEDRGREQARNLVSRLSDVPIEEIVHSPLVRCEQTIEPLARARRLAPVVEQRLAEVDYGEWTGRELKGLLEESLWKVVQQHASAAVFPGGEGLAQVQARAVAAVREHDARLAELHGRDVVWVACSHGDVIKSILVDALGAHLDGLQRIVAEPASISVIRYTSTRPYVLKMNDTGADLAGVNTSPTSGGAEVSGSVPGGEVRL